MHKTFTHLLASLIGLAALTACSEKERSPGTDAVKIAPSPAIVSASSPAPAAATRTAPAPAAVASQASPGSMQKRARLQCEDRTIALAASCSDLDDTGTLTCSSQRLTISGSRGETPVSVRDFVPVKTRDGASSVVVERFGKIACVATKSQERFIVATMGSGGNCEQCEWVDVYSWDGVFLGSEGGKRKKVPAIQDAIAAAFDENSPPIAKMRLRGFYDADTK